MRPHRTFLITTLAAALALAGCKLVSHEERDAKAAAAAEEADVVSATVERVWATEAIPHIEGAAIPLAELSPKIAAGLDAAGAAHGHRQDSEGSPWNFAASFSGRVIEANTESKAANAGIDIDGDGAVDAVVQLGPVIRGTTLRDILPFINFTDFRDQIEFAKLARALNARAYETALDGLPRADLVGAELSGLGVFTMRAAGAKILITPIRITRAP